MVQPEVIMALGTQLTVPSLYSTTRVSCWLVSFALLSCGNREMKNTKTDIKTCMIYAYHNQSLLSVDPLIPVVTLSNLDSNSIVALSNLRNDKVPCHFH